MEATRPQKDWKTYIPEDSSANQAIANWHANQPDRVQTVASPSSLTQCPRAIWLKKHHTPATNVMGWGKSQRLLLGRNFENMIAKQYEANGNLLHHWKDDVQGESDPFSFTTETGYKVVGTPDLLLQLDQVVISDAKTSRSDSFAYVPTDESVWNDPFWYKYKLQLTAYFMLCYKNEGWFKERGLPLPTACHLFSFALDDGIVRREFEWTPTPGDYKTVLEYAKRWNDAYASATMPDCTCSAQETKFCAYAYEFELTKKGAKLGVACCEGASQ